MFKNILISDSDIDSRDRFYEILFSMGYKVDCVPNGKETLVRLQAERPHLLVLDEMIPPDGWVKTLEKIRTFDKELKVMVITKDAPDEYAERDGKRLQTASIIKKDFAAHSMMGKIFELTRDLSEKIPAKAITLSGKILIVDDNPEMRALLTNFLKKKGFDAKAAVNGDQAIMEIKIERPRLVLLDERMPGMDGLLVLKKIKEIDTSIKVAILTGVEDDDIMREAMKFGACDYLVKPVDLQKLEALVISIFMQGKK